MSKILKNININRVFTFFIKRKMKKIILLLILLRILLAVAVEHEVVSMFIESSTRNNLPKLYTWNFKKQKYERILNKNGEITKKYNRGIFLLENSIYKPVHKKKGQALTSTRNSLSKTTKIISKKIVNKKVLIQ